MNTKKQETIGSLFEITATSKNQLKNLAIYLHIKKYIQDNQNIGSVVLFKNNYDDTIIKILNKANIKNIIIFNEDELWRLKVTPEIMFIFINSGPLGSLAFELTYKVVDYLQQANIPLHINATQNNVRVPVITVKQNVTIADCSMSSDSLCEEVASLITNNKGTTCSKCKFTPLKFLPKIMISQEESKKYIKDSTMKDPKDAIAQEKANLKKYVTMQKYSADGFAIKGSWVLKFLFPDFKRQPNDIDLSWNMGKETFMEKFKLFQTKNYLAVNDVKDFFQWNDEGERLEILITVSAFDPREVVFHGYKIVIENPIFVFAQKLTSLFYLQDEVIENRQDYCSDVNFLLNKIDITKISNKMLETICLDYYIVNEDYLVNWISKNVANERINLYIDLKYQKLVQEFFQKLLVIAKLKEKPQEFAYFKFKGSKFDLDN